MTLAELKVYLEIPPEDTSMDVILELYLAAALEYVYARLGPKCLAKWIAAGRLPANARLFIVQYVQRMDSMEGGAVSGAITSERIGGISLSLGSGWKNGAATIDDLWDMLIGDFCDENPAYKGKNTLRVYPAKDKWQQ